jgi:hypothetical protein
LARIQSNWRSVFISKAFPSHTDSYQKWKIFYKRFFSWDKVGLDTSLPFWNSKICLGTIIAIEQRRIMPRQSVGNELTLICLLTWIFSWKIIHWFWKTLVCQDWSFSQLKRYATCIQSGLMFNKSAFRLTCRSFRILYYDIWFCHCLPWCQKSLENSFQDDIWWWPNNKKEIFIWFSPWQMTSLVK